MKKNDAISFLETLNVAPVFKDMWENKFPEKMYFKSTPESYLDISEDLSKVVTDLKHLLPLWVDNGDSVVGYCMSTKKYLQFYYEDGGEENPNEHIDILGANYQQFINSLLLDKLDAGREDEIDYWAELFSYKYLPKLKELYTNNDEEVIEIFHQSLQ